MVVTGFEIFGAVNGALGTLKLIAAVLSAVGSTVIEYRRAARKLLELRDGFNSFIARLENWTYEIWGINGNEPDELYQANWDEKAGKRSGPSSLPSIRFVMKQETKQQSKSRVAQSPDPKDVKARKWWHRKERKKWVDQHKELAKRAKEATNTVDKAKFVLFQSGRLSDYLQDLNDSFNRLHRDANDYYLGVHKRESSSTSTEEKRRAATTSMMLNLVFQTKAATEALYWSCAELGNQNQALHALERTPASPGQTKPGLEMNLALESSLDSSGRHGEPRLRYHLIVAWPNIEEHFEILAEGPMDASSRETQEGGHLVPADSLSSACARLESESVCDLIAKIAREHSFTATFRVEKPVDMIRIQSRRAIDLWNLLHGMKNRNERFYLQDQMSLAFKVVQSGLLLLGTSWLSDLTSKNIQRILDNDYDDTSRLILNAALSPFDEVTTVEPQTFKVGVIMAEIAIALPIESIQSQQTDSGTQLEFVINFSKSSIPDTEPFTADQIVSDVYRHMGKVYSKAVDFCLQQSKSSRRPDWGRIKKFGSWQDRDKAYHDIVVDYYNEVYLPLKEEYSRLIW